MHNIVITLFYIFRFPLFYLFFLLDYIDQCLYPIISVRSSEYRIDFIFFLPVPLRRSAK